MTRLVSLHRRAAAEGGYSVIELLTVLLILGTVLAGLTGLFVSGTRAEVDMNERFRAQLDARMALSKMRREVHCARIADLAVGNPAGSAVKLTQGTGCGGGEVTWCTVQLGTRRFGLFRSPGGTCDATGVRWADHLTEAAVFSYQPPTPDKLGRLRVVFPVDIDPSDARAAYRLEDELALRNTRRN